LTLTSVRKRRAGGRKGSRGVVRSQWIDRAASLARLAIALADLCSASIATRAAPMQA
jgi:hypothetical protein